MAVKIDLGILLVVIFFIVFVATCDGQFRYERSGLINAPKEKIFSYISQLRLGEQWSPFEKMDPGMKKSFSGEDEKVGAKMDFESKKAGSGLLEILNIVSSESVQLRLLMTAPVKAGHFTTGLASLKELVEGQN